MTIAALVQARIWQSWQYYEKELLRVITPLTAADLAQRLVPGQRSVGEQVEHIVRARALWLPRALGEARPALAPLAQWDEPEDPVRTPAEVLAGLELTWAVLAGCIARWPADGDRASLPAAEVEQLQIIWGLFEHELHHGGELALMLGTFGHAVPDM